jgi:hypothetical protein
LPTNATPLPQVVRLLRRRTLLTPKHPTKISAP